MINVDPALLSAVISDIYDTAYHPSSWRVAVEGVRKLFHGSKACVQRIGPDIRPADVVTTNPDPVFDRLFVEEHAGQLDVFTDVLNNTLQGAVYRDHELFGRDQFRRSRFWNEWMAPQDMYGGLGVKLLQDDASFWVLDIQRGKGQDAFGADEAALFRIVTPHVMRALQINQNLQAMQSLASTFQDAPFGVVLVDQGLRILGANSAAETLLARADSKLARMAGRLVVADARSMGLLRGSVINACSAAGDVVPGLGGDLLIKSGSQAHGDLTVSVAPLPGRVDGLPLVGRRAAIFVREIGLGLPTGFDAHLQSLFGLTPREAEIAVALASGLKLRTAAENAGIKLSTARAYLEKVFLKTGTHQQSQLVALLRSVVGT